MAASESDLKDSREQLALVLGFFAKIDARLSTVLAIDTGMLGVLSASFPPASNFRWWLAIAPAVVIMLLALSYIFLYRSGFPDLKGGEGSSVYFAEIAKQTEANFVNRYISQSNDDLRHDVLAQVWRNSEIVLDKYKYLRASFLCMTAAVPAWIASLALFAAHNANIHVTMIH